MSFLSSSRCVLVMGDEGLQIYKAGARNVARVSFVAWDDAEFVQTASHAIAKKCNRAKVIVLNDMVEQHYRKERIPKVSIFDQASVLKRRLNIAFPNYRVRAALKLKDKKAPAAGDKKGNPYLFAAVPASDSFNKVLESIRMSMAPVEGFYLLPIEASLMVRDISKKLAKTKSSVPMWTIFVGQHYNGGLRQIVTRNGELALTRLTPIVDTDVEPDMWAKELAGELDATMSYLSRFGYKPTDGLDVIISANESSKLSLENNINVDADIHLLTSQEISKTLGVKIGKQDDHRYADPVHVAYLSKKKSFLLPLESVAINELIKPRKIASFITLILMAGIAYFGYMAFQNWTVSSKAQSDLVVAKQKVQSISSEYAVELGKQKALGFDFQLVDNALSIYSDLESKKLKPLELINEVGKALGLDLKIQEIEVKQDLVERRNRDFNNYAAQNEQASHKMTARIKISFPSSIDTEVSVGRVNELRSKLAENLLGYEVVIQKQVADLSYTGNFSGGTGVNSTSQTPENYEAIIEISGNIK